MGYWLLDSSLTQIPDDWIYSIALCQLLPWKIWPRTLKFGETIWKCWILLYTGILPTESRPFIYYTIIPLGTSWNWGLVLYSWSRNQSPSLDHHNLRTYSDSLQSPKRLPNNNIYIYITSLLILQMHTYLSSMINDLSIFFPFSIRLLNLNY